MKCGKRGAYDEKREAQEYFCECKEQSIEHGWAALFLSQIRSSCTGT